MTMSVFGPPPRPARCADKALIADVGDLRAHRLDARLPSPDEILLEGVARLERSLARIERLHGARRRLEVPRHADGQHRVERAEDDDQVAWAKTPDEARQLAPRPFGASAGRHVILVEKNAEQPRAVACGCFLFVATRADRRLGLGCSAGRPRRLGGHEADVLHWTQGVALEDLELAPPEIWRSLCRQRPSPPHRVGPVEAEEPRGACADATGTAQTRSSRAASVRTRASDIRTLRS